MADNDLQQDLREYMRWTRECLSTVNDKLTEIEKHSARQNGHIKLVMERERETRAVADNALLTAQKVSSKLVELSTAASIHRSYDVELRGDMSDEVRWLRDNVWKIALGGLTLASLFETLAGFFQKVGGP